MNTLKLYQNPFVTHQIKHCNFGFDGEISIKGSSIDGIDFQLPANPLLTENLLFSNSGDMCPHRGCDHRVEENCACTQVIDIGDLTYGTVVELVLSNKLVDVHNPDGASHPIHLHGHHFYVIKKGYPTYVTGPGKTVHVGTFSVTIKTDLKY